MEFSARERRTLLFRSLFTQSSWNYESLIGTGFAFVLLPVLRRRYSGDPKGFAAAVRRHSELFNSHPYLVTVAVGAVAKLEAEGSPPDLIHRFKTAVRGSLGSLGDQLVWAAWRPALSLAAVVALLLKAPWWAVVIGYLLVYNLFHLYIRRWGLELGLASGIQVGSALRNSRLHTWALWTKRGGAFLAGSAIMLLPDVGFSTGAASWAAVLAGTMAGVWLGTATRRFAWWTVVLGWAIATTLGAISYIR